MDAALLVIHRRADRPRLAVPEGPDPKTSPKIDRTHGTLGTFGALAEDEQDRNDFQVASQPTDESNLTIESEPIKRRIMKIIVLVNGEVDEDFVKDFLNPGTRNSDMKLAHLLKVGQNTSTYYLKKMFLTQELQDFVWRIVVHHQTHKQAPTPDFKHLDDEQQTLVFSQYCTYSVIRHILQPLRDIVDIERVFDPPESDGVCSKACQQLNAHIPRLWVAAALTIVKVADIPRYKTTDPFPRIDNSKVLQAMRICWRDNRDEMPSPLDVPAPYSVWSNPGDKIEVETNPRAWAKAGWAQDVEDQQRKKRRRI